MEQRRSSSARRYATDVSCDHHIVVTAFESLLRDLDNGRVSFKRAILETTGLADPAPVLQTVMSHPYLVMRFQLDGVVTGGSYIAYELAEAYRHYGIQVTWLIRGPRFLRRVLDTLSAG